jgi:hypothetical protein
MADAVPIMGLHRRCALQFMCKTMLGAGAAGFLVQ